MPPLQPCAMQPYLWALDKRQAASFASYDSDRPPHVHNRLL